MCMKVAMVKSLPPTQVLPFPLSFAHVFFSLTRTEIIKIKYKFDIYLMEFIRKIAKAQKVRRPSSMEKMNRIKNR